jgi:hypothetical protein
MNAKRDKMRVSGVSQGLGMWKGIPDERFERFRPRGYFNQRLGARPGVDYGSAGLSELRDMVRWRVSSRSGEVLRSARYGGNVGILRNGHDEASVKYEQPLFLLCSQKDFLHCVSEDATSSIHVTSRQKFHLVFVAALNIFRDLE